MKRILLNLGLIMLCLLCLAPCAKAATRTVNNLTDHNDGVCSIGDCTLREALAASASGDSISFSVVGTITLTNGLPVNNAVTINGPGANNLIINGNNTNTVLSAVADLTLSGVTVANGLSANGGGISNSNGKLTLNNCVIRNNRATASGGGIYNSGSFAIAILNNCTISNNSVTSAMDSRGGGLYNEARAMMTLNNCTITGNSATATSTTQINPVAYGGGLFNYGSGIENGTVTLNECIVSSNSVSGSNAIRSGGAIFSFAGNAAINVNSCIFTNNVAVNSGGAIVNYGPLNVRNSTFSANSSSNGGALYNAGTLTMTNSTLSGNNGGPASGGGLYNDGESATLTNCTLSGNYAAFAGGIQNISTLTLLNTLFQTGTSGANLESSGTVTSSGHNLSNDDGGGFLTGPGDLINTNPLLGPLTFNGGPTQTHELLPGSPALDAGDDSVLGAPLNLNTDQRGPFYARKVFSHVDIGAYELDAAQSGPNFEVNTTNEHRDGNCTMGDCSLWDATDAANEVDDESIVTFKAGLSGIITTALQTSGISLSNPVTIQGPGARVLTISGNNVSRIFEVAAGATATISGLTIANGYSLSAAIASGGGVYNAGNLTLINCAVLNNSGGSGGGLANANLLTVTNCTFAGNRSTGNGGAIRNTGNATLSNSTFWDNRAFSSGAITSSGTNAAPGSVLLQNCTVVGNSATDTANGYGGGLNNYGVSTVYLANSIIAGNTATNGTDLSGPYVSQDYNLIQTPQGAYATLSGPIANTIFNQAPNLGPLANNGGPTDTLALLPGSPAIDKGNVFGGFTTDQRGIARPQGAAADIGAFELQFIPAIAVNNPRSLPEGSAATPGSVTFDITLSGAATEAVTVNYQTVNGSNNPATAGVDYTAKSGKLTFTPGQTLKRVTISFIGDSTVELNETFFFDLKTPTNATIFDNRGVGQINNDDGPGITIANALTVDEGNSGNKPQTFAVTLSAASTDTVTVGYATANGTATTTDYVAASGTLTFAPGETSKLITIQVKGDTTVEPHETYKVILSKVAYAFIADGTGVGTIRNDDAAALLFENDEPSE